MPTNTLTISFVYVIARNHEYVMLHETYIFLINIKMILLTLLPHSQMAHRQLKMQFYNAHL